MPNVENQENTLYAVVISGLPTNLSRATSVPRGKKLYVPFTYLRTSTKYKFAD